jgi:uncharacterized membrane protein YqaE (UPF0057 family)
MTGQDALSGLVTAVITELAKYIPGLNSNALIRAALSIVVVALSVFATNGRWNTLSFVNTLLASFASYKIAVQPVSAGVGLKTQI